MRNWINKLFRPFFAVILGVVLLIGGRQVIRGELSKIEIAFMAICFFAFLILIVNNRKNKILEESMMGLVWTTLAIAVWVHDRSALRAIIWAVLALWSFSFAYAAWKNPRRYAKIYGESADKLQKGNG
ncbi:MAG: hypothetical protein ABSG00_05870 [Terracidiphilus sp.]|jgi:Ca2+/Na+ antiporter